MSSKCCPGSWFLPFLTPQGPLLSFLTVASIGGPAAATDLPKPTPMAAVSVFSEQCRTVAPLNNLPGGSCLCWANKACTHRPVGCEALVTAPTPSLQGALRIPPHGADFVHEPVGVDAALNMQFYSF